MTWREVEVVGLMTRDAVEHSCRDPAAHIELQLAADTLPPHTHELYDMWFVELSITGFDTTSDTDWIDSPDEPMTSVCFYGTITGTDIPIRLVFFREVLDRFMVNLD